MQLKEQAFFNDKYINWKFNDSLLDNNEFVTAIKKTINSNSFDFSASNVLLKFDVLNKILKTDFN